MDAATPAIRQLTDVWARYESPVVLLEEVDESKVSRYGIADGAEIEDGIYRLNDLVEKPEPAAAPSNLAVASRYIFTPDIFEHISRTQPGKGGEIQITDAMRTLVRQRPMYGVRLKGRRCDIGNKEGFVRTNMEFALKARRHACRHAAVHQATGGRAIMADRTASKVLVTGAAGFIGSHLCERLVGMGCHVVGLDNFDSFYDPEIKRRNLSALHGHRRSSIWRRPTSGTSMCCIASWPIRSMIVVHLAAKAGVRPSIEDPMGYQDVNISGTMEVLEAARKFGVEEVHLCVQFERVWEQSEGAVFRDGQCGSPDLAVCGDQEGRASFCAILTAICMVWISPVFGSSRCTGRGNGRTWRFTNLRG